MELRLEKKEVVPPVTGAGETSNHPCSKTHALNSSSWGVSVNQALCNACGREQDPLLSAQCPTIASNQLLTCHMSSFPYHHWDVLLRVSLSYCLEKIINSAGQFLSPILWKYISSNKSQHYSWSLLDPLDTI